MWNCGCRGLTAKLQMDFLTLWRVQAPNPCVVQGSIVCVCECVCVYIFTVFCDMSLFEVKESSQRLGKRLLACMADKRLISSIKKDFLCSLLV